MLKAILSSETLNHSSSGN